MKTIGENTDTTVKTENLHAAPRPQDVMAIAQREQSTAFKAFFKSWRRAKWSHGQETPLTHVAFGVQLRWGHLHVSLPHPLGE